MGANRKSLPPWEVSFLLMDRQSGATMPIESLPPEEWQRLRGEILKNLVSGMDFHSNPQA